MSGDTGNAETHPFQAEVAELLRLMVHSVYSETDIFLRELISNASDACDRLRYEAIANARAAGRRRSAARSASRPTPTAGTLTIADTGIGMDRQELIDNLGTVARSGTRAFIERLAEAKDGRGADRPVRRRLLFRLHGGGPHRGDQPPRRRGGGLGVALVGRRRFRDRAGHRRAGAARAARHRDRPAPQGGREAATSSRYEHRAHGPDLLRPHPLPDRARRRQEASRARSTPRARSGSGRNRSSKPEDYTQAYRSHRRRFDEPAMTLHYRAEGRQSYAVLLFVPSSAPFDLFDPGRKGAGEALCAARLHHRRCRAAAVLPALRARRGRQRGPAAQHLARDAAEQSAGDADPQGAHRPRGRRAGNARRARTPDDLRQDLGRVRPRPQGRASTRITSGAASCSRSRASPRPPAMRRARSSNTSPTSSPTRPRSITSSATAPSG